MTHHERWDGKGYPHGLKGEEIPLAGRIVALADVFDALTTNRVYRPAFGVEEALDTIKADIGHFDPEVTAAFFDILDDILQVRNSYEDVGAPVTYQGRIPGGRRDRGHRQPGDGRAGDRLEAGAGWCCWPAGRGRLRRRVRDCSAAFDRGL